MLGIKDRMAKSARRAGLIGFGGLCCGVGAGFLTLAGWLAFVPLFGTTTAAMILAGVYLGFGLIFIAAGSGETHKAYHPTPEAEQAEAPPNAPPLVQAFLFGMQAGVGAEKGRR